MGKHSKRPGRAARSVHDRIRDTAATLHRAPHFGVHDAAEVPDVEASMAATMRQIEDAIPARVTFEGVTYWMRCELVARLAIYGWQRTAAPLIEGLSFSPRSAGLRPGH